MPSRDSPSVVSAAVIADPLSVKSARGKPRLSSACVTPWDEDLDSFAEVPLRMAAKTRSVIEQAQKLGRDPFSRWQQDLARAVMEVGMP
jgi:hypothetical protein